VASGSGSSRRIPVESGPPAVRSSDEVTPLGVVGGCRLPQTHQLILPDSRPPPAPDSKPHNDRSVLDPTAALTITTARIGGYARGPLSAVDHGLRSASVASVHAHRHRGHRRRRSAVKDWKPHSPVPSAPNVPTGRATVTNGDLRYRVRSAGRGAGGRPRRPTGWRGSGCRAGAVSLRSEQPRRRSRGDHFQ
jgi:hypothetical protein